jgi:dipicolinate synthase subunit A
LDYYEDETLQIRNAHITAEGAVMTAMDLTDRTIHGSRMAVVGYGRIGRMLSRMLVALGAKVTVYSIGRMLSRMLVALGAKVTVYARRSDALAWAETDGCETMLLPASAGDVRPGRLRALRSLCHGYDVIFNTVPARMLGRDDWKGMERNTLWIELASAPGGVDPEMARSLAGQTGLRVVWAPSLPGRYAPVGAGEEIARWILNQEEAEDPRGGVGYDK